MMEHAKIAVMTKINSNFELRSYPLTPPPEGMARLKLVASGVCGTDVHIREGRLPVATPAAIGHEFVGTVEEASGSGIGPGDNAIVYIARPCGECPLCANGDDANCVRMEVTNSENPDVPPHFYGGFGEYNYTPIENLIKIPPELPPERVCAFACAGPTAMRAFRLGMNAGLEPGRIKTAVIQGLGPIGLFAAAYLSAAGAEQIVSVTRTADERRERAARSLGVTECLRLSEHAPTDIAGRVLDMTDGLGADLVYEASGNPSAFRLGLDMLRNRGMYLLPGQYSDSGTVSIPPQIITFKALRVIGASQYSKSDVTSYLKFFAEDPRVAEAAASITDRYPLHDIDRAFDDASAGKNIKTMIVPQG